MSYLPQSKHILIIGMGVMGGSYAKALSKKGYRLRCITKEQRDIDYALQKGMIEAGTTQVEPSLIAWADLIVFSLYPLTFIEWMECYGGYIRPGTLITDVCGVKCGVIDKINALLPVGVEFISSHPMAGRERSGVEYSDDSVFTGANYLVVPTEKNTEAAIETCKELGQLLGFYKITVIDAPSHDRMIAFLSQLTHIIAVVLMNCDSEPHMEKYTGDSFRDLTRIAKINDRMWSELFLLNKPALLAKMDEFMAEFSAFRDLLEAEDGEHMRERMRAGAARRSLFDKPEAKLQNTEKKEGTKP